MAELVIVTKLAILQNVVPLLVKLNIGKKDETQHQNHGELAHIDEGLYTRPRRH